MKKKKEEKLAREIKHFIYSSMWPDIVELQDLLDESSEDAEDRFDTENPKVQAMFQQYFNEARRVIIFLEAAGWKHELYRFKTACNPVVIWNPPGTIEHAKLMKEEEKLKKKYS